MLAGDKNIGPILSVKETSVYLGMSMQWCYGTLKRLIPHVKVGGALKFRKEDLDRYIESQTFQPMEMRDVKSYVSLKELLRGKSV